MGLLTKSKMTKDEYIREFRKKRSHNNFFWYLDDNINTWLNIIIVVGAAAVPYLLNVTSVPKLIPTIISGVVAVAAAVATNFKFNERSLRRFVAYEEMTEELNAYDLKEGIYAGLGDEQAFTQFYKRAEDMKRKYMYTVFFYGNAKNKKKASEKDQESDTQ